MSKTAAKPTKLPEPPKRVTIEKAQNGFVVEKYNDMGRNKVHVAKTHTEAMKIMKKLMK